VNVRGHRTSREASAGARFAGVCPVVSWQVTLRSKHGVAPAARGWWP
jgi:hypothetical protein